MKLYRRTLPGILLLLVLAAVWVPSVFADSPVWKITKGDRQLFIGGTVHVLGKGDYPLPEAFETAYRAATTVVFEADPRALQTPEFQKALLSRATYPPGRDLTMDLDDETEKALARYLASRGIPTDNIMRFKAGMVSITLTMVELQRLGLAGTGVDEFFSLRALQDRKEVLGLETADAQLDFIATMGEGREDALIAYTLRQVEALPDLMQAMKAAWRTGDNEKLEAVAMQPLEQDFPEVQEQFLKERNAAWLPKIEAMLATAPVELVLVGALHLVGEKGLLAQLQKRGCTIQNL
jgi:uncharacterized protein YbaP (TraB family)